VSEQGKQNRTVMLVDDSLTIRRSAELLLTQAGFDVISVADGFDALGAISDHNPDIILMDINMPRLDGYRACILLKQNDLTRDIPIIMLSGSNSPFDRARGDLAGAVSFLSKPFSGDELLREVRTQLPAS
jgi:twitching motility two-component system response regulator PilG